MKTLYFSVSILVTILSARAQNPTINEFLARNSGGLEDAGGETPDWIEIANTGSETISLDAYRLVAGGDEWPFPEGSSIGAGEFIIIFASGKNRPDPDGTLHTNFRLSGGGERLVLERISDNVVVSGFEPSYPEQERNVSYGRSAGITQPQYFDPPTPGAANSEGFVARLPEPIFSTQRGFFDTAFSLELSSDAAGSTVIYTVDGSEPAVGNGMPATGPVAVSTTTVVRARSIQNGYLASPTATHTYIFPADVVGQSAAPAGFPDRWASVPADYEMDPGITGGDATAVRDALLSLPSVSIATSKENLFDRAIGIYANSLQSGAAWERPASVEWITRAGETAFTIDCGLRIQGGFFRGPTVTRKHSFRILFKDEYGEDTLRHDIFKTPLAATEFDSLIFRAGANDGYSTGAAAGTAQWIRDDMGRGIMRALGHPAAHGTYVHLYLDGLYWGLYNLVERPNEDFSASTYGGGPEEWDANNAGEVKNGTGGAWDALVSKTRGTDTPEEYLEIQGRNPDGSRTGAYPTLFDPTNYIDYMLANIWGGNWDWPNKNFWFGRRDSPHSTGFKFYLWDFENTMGNSRQRSPLNMRTPRSAVAGQGVGILHERLRRGSSEYRVEFGDRVQAHFFGGGPLAPDALTARYSALAASVAPAVLAESARWGDDRVEPPQEVADWVAERDYVLDTYLPARTEIVLGQLRSSGLYPDVAAPELSGLGGLVAPGTVVSIGAAGSQIVFTTNGLDPRRPGGQPEPAATAAAGSASIGVDGPTHVRARARNVGTGDWSALVEAVFVPDVPTEPVALADIAISEIHPRPTGATSSSEDAVSRDRDDYEFIELLNTSSSPVDLTGAAFSAGIEYAFPDNTILAPGDRYLLVDSPRAFRARYGNRISIDGNYKGNLADRGEELHIVHVPSAKPLLTVTYGDPGNEGHSIVLRADRAPRASSFPGGNPGTTDAVQFLGGATDDSDGDGLSRLMEYAQGTSDFDRADGPAAFSIASEAGFTRIYFQRNLAADDVSLTLEFSADLELWGSPPTPPTRVGSEPQGDGNSIDSFTIPRSAHPSFLRLRAMRIQ